MTAAFAHLEVDPSLLTAAIDGEQQAQEQLFRQFEGPVYNLAARICQCRDEAFDILQDVFIQAFSRIDQFRNDAPFWSWLRQITVNTCLSRLRAIKRRDLKLIGNADRFALADNPGDQLDLSGAFARLPVEARSVVWLYDVEGYSHKEIAAMFGRSVSFSKTQLCRAHERLRDWLDQDDEDPICAQSIPVN
jgi:RNA polymerase sigma factor (sigma-70 family)